MLLTCHSRKWIRNVGKAGKADSSWLSVQTNCTICHSIKSTVLFRHNWFRIMVSLQHYQFPRAKHFHFSLIRIFHISKLYINPFLLNGYCGKSLPATSSFRQKCHMHSYRHYVNTLWMRAFFFNFSSYVFVRVLCVYMLSFVTPRFDLIE